MYAIVFRAVPTAGNRQNLLEFLQWDCEVARQKEPGTLRFDVLEDPEGEAIYVYECYEDRAAFEVHKKNAPYQKWVSDIEPRVKVTRLFEGEPVCVLGGTQVRG
jgi:quinol monooxygenase YgiN